MNTAALTINPFILIASQTHFKKLSALKIFYFFVFVSIIILSSFYIFQANVMTKETYLIQGYQRELSETAQENMDLEISFSQMNSLVNVEDLVRGLNFEKVTQVHYLKVSEGQMVAK